MLAVPSAIAQPGKLSNIARHCPLGWLIQNELHSGLSAKYFFDAILHKNDFPKFLGQNIEK